MIGDIIRALVAKGATPEMILAAVDAAEAATASKREEKRLKDAERQRRHRAKPDDVTRDMSRIVTVTSRDTKEKVSDFKKKEEISQVPKSEPSRRAPTHVENLGFQARFWPAYPHKVGKPAASKAYLAAKRRGASDDEICAGLDRYIREKPPDRQWLNPATFLNQDRFRDQPAAIAADRPQHQRPRSSADGLLGAFGRLFGAQEGVHDDGGPSAPPSRNGADHEPAPGGGGIRGAIEIIPPNRGH